MSAEILRRAAAQMRGDYPIGPRCPDRCKCDDEVAAASYHPHADGMNAMADVLDSIAEEGWTDEDYADDSDFVGRAFLAARTYLGEDA